MNAKASKLFLSFFLFLALNSPASACGVCFGNPDSLQTQGVEAAILTLLGITYATILTIIGAFVYRRFRARRGH